MYADRYDRSTAVKPGSLATAVAINGALIAAVMFAAPDIMPQKPPGTLLTENIPIPPLPPIEPQPAEKATTVPKRPVQVERKIEIEQPPVDVGTGPGWLTPPGTEDTGSGAGTVVIDPPTPPSPPVLIEPSLDRRFAGAFQPEYPAAERRLEREGSVVVRALIGVDGRVKEIERVSATSDDFFNATRRTALARWRFRPGTRGGVPIESWKTMRVTFRLQEG